MTALGEDAVLLRWLELAAVEPGHWPALRGLLDEAERARADRFHFERDRLVYTAAHALLRASLAELTGRAARDWRFSLGAHGKPEALCLPGEPALRVNLSHTRGMAAVALTLGRDVGVDVEWTRRDNQILDIADRFFAPAECAYLDARPRSEAAETFFAFWTLKESYIKAVGMGLALPLDAFAFSLDPLEIAFDARIADEPRHWRFARFHPGPEHALAVAVRDPRPERLDIAAEAVDPAGLLRLAR